MDRREAIKRIGMALAGAAVMGTGAASLASCGKKGTKRIIFYFTGTGNCLYVARQIGGDGALLLSIPQIMKQGELNFEADEIGLMYPIYGHMPPNMVRKFIKKARLKAEYKFAVLTYGNRKCNASEIWDDISRRAGNAFDYVTTMIMVDNWLPNFDMNEQIKIDKHIPESLARITADVSARRRWIEPATEEERQQHQGFIAATGIDPEKGFTWDSAQCFTVTNACIGCGVCADVCPRGNWSLTSSGVKTEGECEACFACIQNCPQRAIQFNKEGNIMLAAGEKNPNARYRNEHVSLWDIKQANRQ